MNLLQFTLIFSITLTISYCQEIVNKDEQELECVGETTCFGCIAAGPNCSWCKQKNFTGNRCDKIEILQQNNCKSIYKKGNSSVNILGNENFSDFKQGNSSSAIQIKPQNAKIQLRTGRSGTKISLTYRAANNYPLDVYYLMDLTSSMRGDKETLALIAGDLADTLQNLTENFKLGFGSFVDKPVMPFVDQARIENPCSSEKGFCAPAYGYKHHFSLGQDTQGFIEQVKNAEISGNVDNAEGSLDALLQSVVCKDIIGWSSNSRKIVVLVSDGILHFAGDGLLGGAIKRHDGKCYIDTETGLYTMSSYFDYPSLAEIDKILLDNKVNTIFAVPQKRIIDYSRLLDVLQSPAVVAKLEKNSSNIIELVTEGYKDIVSSLLFKDNSTNPLRIVYKTNCGGTESFHESSSCEQVEFGKEYKFDLELYADTCPKDPLLWKQRVEITERGITEGLKLDIELMCGCTDCDYEENSEYCSSNGDYDCGICSCHSGWYGPTCQCSESNATILYEDECLPPEAALDGAEICSGRGDCICGKCECFGDIYGKYCECDNTLCDMWNGERCGGPTKGRCNCGKCICEPGWSGSSCSCSTNNDLCMAPGGSKLCSGNGRCECGQCICDQASPEARYTGKFCEKCDTCTGLCTLYEGCVLCKAFNNSCPIETNVDLCHTNTGNAYIDIVTDLILLEGEEFCQFIKDNCIYKFAYKVDENRRAKLRVLLSKSCSNEINVAAAIYISGIIAAILLIGLALLLIWKIFVYNKDKRDYEKFKLLSETAMKEAGENPIYKPATTTYFVPDNFRGPLEPLTSPTLTVSSDRSWSPTTPLQDTPF